MCVIYAGVADIADSHIDRDQLRIQSYWYGRLG